MRIIMTRSVALATTAMYLSLQKLFPNNVIIWANGFEVSCDNLESVSDYPTRLVHFSGRLDGFEKKPSITVTVNVSKNKHRDGWIVNESTVLCTIDDGKVWFRGIRCIEEVHGIDSCTIFVTKDGDLSKLYLK